MWGELPLLVNYADARLDRLVGGMKLHLLIVDEDFSAGVPVVAVENFEQRGLSGSVFAEKGNDFVLVHAKAHVVQRFDAGEFHADFFKPQVFRHSASLLPIVECLGVCPLFPSFAFSVYGNPGQKSVQKINPKL